MKTWKKEKNKGGNKDRKKWMVLAGWLLCAVGFLAGGTVILGISGKYNLRTQAVSYAAAMEEAVQADELTSEEADDWQEGWIRYQGKTYRYKEDILTFLFMGIDKNRDVLPNGTKGSGQADALFLLIIDPYEEAVKLLPINRSTMTQIVLYDMESAGRNTVEAQICVQYGFGDGGKKSCEYQIDAVRELLYGIPVNGYIAVDMDVIPAVTDAVGGIDLTALDDVRNGKKEIIIRKGEQVHLNGDLAYWYVRDRNTSEELSADARLARQRQFLTEFIHRMRGILGKDLGAPVRIFREISGRAVTDITADEVIYLTASAGGYHFDAGQVYTIPGESISGEANADSEFDEFRVDEDGLFELILEIFYESVE